MRAPLRAASDERSHSGLLELQFSASRRARATSFPTAIEQLILLGGAPAGSLITARDPGVLHLIEIALVPGARGRGIGTIVLRHLLALADDERRTVRAFVYRTNPRAHALYRRLGFTDVAADELMFTIERTPGPAPAPAPN